MSYDPPTQRIPPQQPIPPAGGPYERDVVVDDPEREQLRDRIRSLQTALAVLGVLTLAALGIALYTLLADSEEGGRDRRGASPARVAELRDRVNTLENRIDDRATKSSVSDLKAQQQDLENQIEEIDAKASKTPDSGPDEQTTQAIEDVQSDVQALDQRVEDLESQSGGGGTP